MDKSLLNRIFPASNSSPLLPQHSLRSPSASSRRSSERAASPSRVHNSSASQAILSPIPFSASVVSHHDPFMHIDRASKALQDTIQSILDAQSDGLAANLNGGIQDDASSSGVLTPTPSTPLSSQRTKNGLVIPVRQPVKRRLTLQGARKSLGRAMGDFIDLRQEEMNILDNQLSVRDTALKMADNFVQRKKGLQDHIAGIQGDNSAQHAQEMQAEADKLANEIQELEDKLMNLKNRHQYLTDEASQVDNTVQSRVSSYQNSLRDLEKDIQRFVEKPPVTQDATMRSISLGGSRSHFAKLNPKRRTLDLVQEQWRSETELLNAKADDVQNEMSALQEGMTVWREVVTEVKAFETLIKQETQHMSESMLQSTPDMDPMLQKMDKTIDFVSQRLRLAEDHEWNLLIAAVGAELHALEQGKALLLDALGLASPSQQDGEAEERSSSNDPDRKPSNESLRATLEAMNGRPQEAQEPESPEELAFQHKPRGETMASTSGSRSDTDDDPGPDFLISHS